MTIIRIRPMKKMNWRNYLWKILRERKFKSRKLISRSVAPLFIDRGRKEMVSCLANFTNLLFKTHLQWEIKSLLKPRKKKTISMLQRTWARNPFWI